MRASSGRTAKECSPALEVRRRERRLDVPATEQIVELRFVRRPVAFSLLVLVEQILRGCEHGLVLVARADEFTQEVRKILGLREARELGRVVQADVEQPLNLRFR